MIDDQAAERRDLSTPEPPPISNREPAVWDLVITDMRERDASGLAKYGTRLQPFNGRNALVDGYQELLDLSVYLRQHIFEQEKMLRELDALRVIHAVAALWVSGRCDQQAVVRAQTERVLFATVEAYTQGKDVQGAFLAAQQYEEELARNADARQHTEET